MTSHKAVLVVEDSKVQRTMLSEYLTSAGVETVTASDGEQALQQFKRYRPRLVLLDVVLPRMNGYEVLRRLKRLSRDKPAVVMCTIKGEKCDRYWAEHQGADGYLVKPIHPQQLIQIVKQFLNPEWMNSSVG
ncbi:MAG TPA: two-component system response regulator [Cyanobacteria bacterium UBA12227]|nr:two-component system response regulator [Cyanobacteria bacterium UBA12227]HAX88460.1 two-component system response regulator [Cyanobacteria bacterium UBA11370]HBY75624.1 two-component system response regulator [Cyanobacteria bacterium UBA11148]